jgi:DMSO/TMAO reductase YedYZ molybdopterin-dependent catalytic subunit
MKKIYITILILAVAVGIMAWLNQGDLEEKKRSQEDAVLYLVYGEEELELTFSEILALPQHEFAAVLRSSGKAPVDTTFKGVELNQILAAKGVSLEGISQVVTFAVDGYTIALMGTEVRMADNVYVVFERDGEDLGTRESGGSGPYQLVIRQDEFGTRWNKYLMRMEVQ